MTAREQQEYTELRATIRERGTIRVCVFAAGLVAWAALTLATAVLATTPIATLLPLLALAAIFEAVFALHVGVERIGRYLQVYYETDETGARWEHAAMAFGRPSGAATSCRMSAPLQRSFTTPKPARCSGKKTRRASGPLPASPR